MPASPEGEYTSASAGRLGGVFSGLTSRIGESAAGMLGVTQLQTTVDKLEQIVTAFGTTVTTLSNTVGTLSQNAGPAKLGGTQQSAPRGPAGNTPGFNPAQGFNPGSNTAGGGGQSTLKFGPVSYQAPTQKVSRGGFSAVVPATAAGWGATIGASAGSGAAQMGQNLLPNMATMGLTIQSTSLAAPGGFSAAYAASLAKTQAFGSNAIATSVQDAAQMTAAVQQVGFRGGSPFVQGPGSSLAGRNAMGAAYGFGITNPGLTGAAAGMLSQNLYSPATALRMQMLGLTPPLIPGSSGTRSLATVASSFLTQNFGGRMPSMRELNGSLAGTLGAQANYLFGSQAPQMVPLLQAVQKLSARGMTTQGMDRLFSQAGQNKGDAQATLDRYLGVQQGTQASQALKNLNAKKMGVEANIQGGYAQGLNSATTALGDFYTVLQKITKGPLGEIAGWGLGGAGVMGKVASGGAGLLAGLGVPKLLGMLGKGKAAGGDAVDAVARTVAAWGGTAEKAPGLLARGGPLLGRVGDLGASGFGGSPDMLPALPRAKGIRDPGAPPAGSIQPSPLDSLWHWITAARGGVVPGYAPGRDTRIAAVSPGEGILVPEAVRGIGGAKAINALNQKYMGYRDGRSAGYAKGGVVSGTEVAAYARKFATGKGHPYALGGASPSGWDCSGFSAYIYEHFGLFPGHPGQRYGTSESQYHDSHLTPSGPVPGALAFFAGDGSFPFPGHVGVVVDSSHYVSAYDTAEGTIMTRIHGTSGRVGGFRVPKKGFAGGRAAGGGGTGSSPPSTGGTGGSGGTGGTGGTGGMIGGNEGTYGSVNEVDSYGGGAPGGTTPGGPPSGGQPGAAHAPVPGSGGNANAGVKGAQSYARSRVSTHGWGLSQMSPLISLWNQESGWNRHARNPTSGAYGIPQALPASKMGPAANPPQSSAAAQIDWGLSYIKGRYGSPSAAEAHERAVGWYAGGTSGARPGWAWTGERGPELIRLTGGEQILSASQSAHLARTAAKGTAEVPVSPSGGHGATVTLNFTKGSVVLQMDPAKDTTAPSKAARYFVDEIAKRLENERVIQMIAAGVK